MLGAVALLIVCILCGGLAGMAYSFTTGLRAAHPIGRYLGWIIICETYLFSAAACIEGAQALDERLNVGVSFLEPWLLGLLAAVGLMLGISCAYQVRDRRQRRDAVRARRPEAGG